MTTERPPLGPLTRIDRPGGLQPQLQRLERREVAQSQERRGRGQALLDRVVGRGPGVVGDVEERGQRRQADQLRLGQLDAVLGRELARPPPRPATAA